MKVLKFNALIFQCPPCSSFHWKKSIQTIPKPYVGNVMVFREKTEGNPQGGGELFDFWKGDANMLIWGGLKFGVGELYGV